MKYQDGFFASVANTRIYHQSWLPNGMAKAGIVLVHGLAEHSGRYANLVNHLITRDYAMYGLDHIGHGKSDGVRVYAKQFADFTEVLCSYVDQVRA
ncbi:unnamed protein product, partial [marine sediment metagenome]